MITLREYVPEDIAQSELTGEDAERLDRLHGKRITVEYPSWRTNNNYRLTSQGWVGTIPLTADLVLRLAPKVPIVDLFRMLEYAYDLESFHLDDGLVASDSLDSVYDRIAAILAMRILDRARKGFYRNYVREEDRLPYVRGSLQLMKSMRAPWDPRIACEYEEHTADLDENRILFWTLHTILRQVQCRPTTRSLVRRGWRTLAGVASHQRYRGSDCVGRLYHRLNDDYEPLHALCRFFLDHAGPTHNQGDRDMLPFLVDMAKLYESYVARYLRKKLDARYHLNAQEKYKISASGALEIIIDLELIDHETNKTVAVLDTKYKAPDKPSSDDLHQIVAYAVARRCKRGILIYPTMPTTPMTGRYGAGDIEVETAVVSPDGDIKGAVLDYLRDPIVDKRRAAF